MQQRKRKRITEHCSYKNPLILFFVSLFTIAQACNKEPQRQSTEVLLDIINACEAALTIKNLSAGTTQHEYYDCLEANILQINLKEGVYQIIAEGEGRRTKIYFSKTKYAQSLTIEL